MEQVAITLCSKEDLELDDLLRALSDDEYLSANLILAMANDRPDISYKRINNVAITDTQVFFCFYTKDLVKIEDGGNKD